ncbi:hypothetical protein, conserved [Babesia bigemina]|uniref:Uncharacterized protein n=1 Tax=Babesia bigemina TaxID=5866 RepID=A0A061DEB4_BABBI|nr:hypothetical protein, conserved [Babesia bigemina]CDR97000.1 hypothetical protein, conserved [Babesia bigemina]|eukprot:XP_012769186.1 hypothetical protein, conserved [Babesia bigemina]
MASWAIHAAHESAGRGEAGAVDASGRGEVVEESLVLLDFPDFLTTSVFDGAVFRQVSEDATGSTYAIDNCNFNSLRLEGLDGAEPKCVLNGQIPFKGKRVSEGVTYFCFDIAEPNAESETNHNEPKRNAPYLREYWHTEKLIQFNTPI